MSGSVFLRDAAGRGASPSPTRLFCFADTLISCFSPCDMFFSDLLAPPSQFRLCLTPEQENGRW